jgi:hypothetical protein
MRTLIGAIGVLALVAGIVLLVYAYTFPQRFDLSQSTAIQAQEVYTRAIYWAMLTVAVLLFGGICTISYAIEIQVRKSSAYSQAIVNQLNDLDQKLKTL